jgi:hypothetical protein
MFMKKKLIFGLVIIFLGASLLWFYSHAYIEVTVSNNLNNSDLINYSLKNQSNQEVVEKSVADSKFKKLVRRGSYEVLVTQNETSHFSVTKTGGFLSNTTVNAELAPEKNRQFIGNNPTPCMHYLEQTLISFVCGNEINKAQTHVAATATRPTYTKAAQTLSVGNIEGVAKTDDGDVILLKAPIIGESQGPPHSAYMLNKDIDLGRAVPLLDLDEDKTYSLLAYKQGFIVYDSGFERVLYYEDIDSDPEEIELIKPEDNKQLPYALNVHQENIVVSYSNNSKGEVASDKKSNRKVRSYVVVQGNGSSKQYEFKRKQPILANLCGNSKLCFLNKLDLEVHSLNSNKADLAFLVSDVHFFGSLGNDIIVAKDKEILGLNPDTGEGSIQYSLGSYSECGVRMTDDGYIVCLLNSAGKKAAILVDPAQENSTSIDKKALGLLEIPGVKDVSVYKDFIFISPELGQLVYDPKTRIYRPNPAILQAVNSAINQAVQDLRIDKTKYKIINFYD